MMPRTMMPSTMRLLISLPLALACALPAQQQPTRTFAARDFLIPDYENYMFADLKKMRDREVWDELESSLLKLVFKRMEQEHGFPLADLDRVTATMSFGSADAPENVATVRVLEGNKPLPLKESLLRGRWQTGTVGAFEVWRRESRGENLFVQPTDKMQVWGTSAALQPALEKKRVALPSAEVMAFLSGRSESLAGFVFGLNHPDTKKRFLEQMLGGADWPADDQPTMIGLRILATGDEDDPHLAIEAVLRHGKAGKGLQVTEGLADGLLKKFAANPELRLVRPLLKKVDKKVEGAEMVLRLDLGRVRNAVGHLAVLAMPLFLGGEASSAEAAPRPQKEERGQQPRPAAGGKL